ncbi:MAG: CD225/dispanin family protein [Candidatus Phosphoribacter sp.]
MPYGGGMGTPPPQNNLVLAILATVLCCLPLGIVAIIKASKVNGLWAVGDQAGAHAAAAEAKKWSIISAVSGLVVGAIYLIFILFVASAGVSTR